MNLIFWNLNKGNYPGLIKGLIEEQNIDIIALSEHKLLNKEYLMSRLKSYTLIIPPGSDKIAFIARDNLFPKPVLGQNEYAGIMINDTNHENDDRSFLIIGIHLAATSFGEAIREDSSRDIVEDVNRLETERSIDKTILLGDFNENPFDKEMIRHRNFNAVLFKDLILQKEIITWNGKKCKRFYNPMLDMISEETKQYGSYYFDDRNGGIYWECLDQVLVRKSLANLIERVEYIKQIGNESLMTAKGHIRKTYSDHLPLFVAIKSD